MDTCIVLFIHIFWSRETILVYTILNVCNHIKCTKYKAYAILYMFAQISYVEHVPAGGFEEVFNFAF